MISIDRISFEFGMNDESFAHSLYADWDSFCRTCFENIVEECLSVYNKDRMLHEIEKLDLDLGSIPQEDFYSEYPKRLREELLKVLPSYPLVQADMKKVKTVASRFANLLYYLEHGVLKTEWADVSFNLSEELGELMTQDKRYTEKVVGLCLANEYVLRRLLLQTDNDTPLVHLYSITMNQTFSVNDEKRRFMEIFLDMQPDLPVRFVHEVEEDGQLRSMAELLDTHSVRRMMEKEAEEHAEVDLPPYWHYLYEWLIKYYPFNGLVIFGGKSDFVSYLHYRLLTFIHKRNNTFYLSKMELTASFLLEVFGAAYYKEVLNAIYNMQPRNADDSPTYDGYYNRELYRIFIQLSLLNLPETSENVADVNIPEEDTDPLLVDFRMEELHLSENETKDLRFFTGQDENEINENIRRLRMLLAARNLAEAVKRRLVVSFLEQHKDRYADVILELHEEGLLEGAINLISLSATKSVIRQMATRYIGTDKTEKLLLLIDRLFANENSVSTYMKNKSLPLRMQVLVWLAKGTKTQTSTGKAYMELFPLFLASLFGKENVSAVIRLVVCGIGEEVATDEAKCYDILEVIDLLSYTETSRVRHAMSIFEQWSQNIKEHSSTVQTLLQHHWNTSGSFMEWLKDAGVTTESKHKLLQVLAREKPQELVGIFRNLPRGEETVPLMATHLSTGVLLDVAVKIDAKQGLLLSQTIDLLQREQGRFAFLSNMTMPFATALSEAFLLFMQDKDTLGGRNLTEQEVAGKFLACLYYVYTRRTDYNDNAEWKHLQDEVTNGIGLNSTEAVSENTISERLLSEYGSLNDSEVCHLMITVLDKQPELFIQLSEKDTGTDFIRRISGIVDRAMLRRIVTVISSVPGFENHTAFIRLVEWLGILSADRMPTSDIVSVLRSWMSTTDWKKQSIRQMTLFFISRLYGSVDTVSLPLEMLIDDALPEEVRKQLLRNYMRSRPADLLSYIQRLAVQGKLPMDKWAEWAEWADLSEWLRLAASVSLTLEELLRQIIEDLLSQGKPMNNETALKHGLATFIATNDTARFVYYVDKMEVVRSFVLSLPSIQDMTENKKEEMMSKVMENLGITSEEEKRLESSLENDLEIAFVGNAGLCLFSPWFERLFYMVGYLDEERKDFKDTASRIRAVFLLQYLVNPEKKEYREPELAFNRLLVALPAQVSLPKQIDLTGNEKRTANSMVVAVKTNWKKMDGISVAGFRQSFIVRDGQLEQQDEKWLLTIKSRAHDVLLDSLPWAFRQIRFSWLKKYIQVSWHEKQEF